MVTPERLGLDGKQFKEGHLIVGFTLVDIINLLALLVSIAAAFMMFYFSPVINSQVYIYRKTETDIIKKRDDRNNKMLRHGMFSLFMGFILQAIVIFLSVAIKK